MNRISRNCAQLLLILIVLTVLSGCTTTGHTSINDLSPNPMAVKNHNTDPDQAKGHETQIMRIYQQSAENRQALAVQTGRYSALAAIPTTPQRYPLKVIIDVRIPDDIITIGQTINYLLRRSGYTLNTDLPTDVVELLTKPLPDVHRNLGPITLKDALTILSTPSYVPVEDPETRVISYSRLNDPMVDPL